MDSVGERLRQARIQAGLSLGEVSARTKIRTSLLDAIDRGKFEQLPQGLLARGFLRAYAREVGLDPESIVRQFRGEFEPDLADRDVSSAPGAVAGGERMPVYDVAPAWQRQLLSAAAMSLLAAALLVLLNRSAGMDAPVPFEPVGTAGEAEPGVASGLDQGR